jgi:hypothetical protein
MQKGHKNAKKMRGVTFVVSRGEAKSIFRKRNLVLDQYVYKTLDNGKDTYKNSY